MSNKTKGRKPQDGSESDDVEEEVKNLALVNKGKGEEEDDEEEEQYPASVLKRLIALKQLQSQVEEVDVEYKKERVALEKKYAALRSPFFDKRSHIVTGQIEVEVTLPEGAIVAPDNGEEIKGIPGFWTQCLRNHNIIAGLITEEDVPVLNALTNIEVSHNENMSGFTLTFTFDENEYFTNKTLTKSYTVDPDLLDEKAPALTSVEGTTIDWKPKKNLCVKEERKKQKGKSGKKAGQIRYVTRQTPTPSFFHYFSDPIMNPSNHDDEEDDDDEEGNANKKPSEDEFRLGVDEDYEIGHSFRSEIIPEAVLWFTGEAADDDEFDFGEEGDDEDEEDGDESGPASESEDAGPGLTGNAQTGFGVPPTAGGAGAQPGECKQS